MKVERKVIEPAFVPIVITLETEEEASHLWHKLNNTSSIWADYCRKRGISTNTAGYGLNFLMWDTLHKVFDPAGEDC